MKNLDNRNKTFFGLGTIGRDMFYAFEANTILYFLTHVLSLPEWVFLTVTIFSCIWHWNESYLSSMFMTDIKPLAVMLDGFSSAQQAGADNRMTRMAACLLFIAPMLILYMFLQRKFVQSIDRVGIVG